MTIKEKKIKLWHPILIAVLFFVIFILISTYFIFKIGKANDELIAQDIAVLDNIFKQVNQSCRILEFNSKKIYIDFLNVKEFAGSIIGSMFLGDPQNWKGPYLKENLAASGMEYQIIRAKNGYYIIPGDGVALSNGKIINKTLIFTRDSDIEKLILDTKYLLSSKGPLAAYIELAENPDRKQNDELIVEHIEKLKNIFTDINQKCKIIGFRHKKDVINFLNIKSFSGSIVGSMSLVNPKNWSGPYLEHNLTINNKLYQIIKTNKGYYILPGNGVDLENGQIVGKTLIINENSDIDTLMLDPKALSSNGRPLATKIELFQSLTEKIATEDFLDNKIEAYY